MKKGIALVTAMIVMIFLLIIGGVILYLSIRNMQILSSGRRVQNVIEATEAGVEQSVNSIENFVLGGALDTLQHYKLGKYDVDVKVVPFYNEFVSGSGTEFSTGYESIGTETSGGGMSKIFIIHSRAKGPRGERRNLQVLYRKIIGVPGR